jgi:hypothetical protein
MDDPIDIHDVQKVLKDGQNLLKLAVEYRIAKERSAEAKYMLDLSLSESMSVLRGKKNNLGYETAVILLLEIATDGIKESYGDYLKSKATAEGLEKVISALQTQISLFQSITKTLPK